MTSSEPAEWHEQIATALEVERFEKDLFRSKTLWIPRRARGVFGGQVISQALMAATNTVDPAYGLHSLHCYFLLSAAASTPIVYFVERLRDGRSYLTRAVKALQDGRVVFMMMCSFHLPEPWQPTGQWRMPPGVPMPEDCVLEEDKYAKLIREGGDTLHPKIRQIYQEFINDRLKSPIAVKVAVEHATPSESGTRFFMYWMRARDVPAYEAPFQKCILSYMSDLYLLGAASRTLGLERLSKGPNAVSMTSTIDHSICFYDDKFDCGDWLLYVMTSPRAASGRAIVNAQMYTRNGTLVAVTTQEGVVRADRRGPEAAIAAKAKL